MKAWFGSAKQLGHNVWFKLFLLLGFFVPPLVQFTYR